MSALRRVWTFVQQCMCARCAKRTPATQPNTSSHHPPPPDESGPKRMKALFDFEAVQEGDLSFNCGEKLLVTVNEDDDWWEAESLQTGEMGMIPRNYVILDNNDKESQTYYDFIFVAIG